jgi:hypothetical protein
MMCVPFNWLHGVVRRLEGSTPLAVAFCGLLFARQAEALAPMNVGKNL